jgi:uncharacterized protein
MEEDTPNQYKSISWGPVHAIAASIFIYVASQIVGIFLAFVYPTIQGWDARQAGEWLSESIVAQFVFVLGTQTAALLLLGEILRRKKSSFRAIGLKKPRLSDVGQAILGFGAYFVLYIVAFEITMWLAPGVNVDQQQQLGFDTETTGLALGLVFVSLVVLPPLVEEIVVRGFMFSGLRTKMSFIKAAVVSSVIFGIAHLQFGSGAPLLWIAAIDTFILGMVLAYLREKSGSLIAPILLHALKNAIAFSLLFVFTIT